VEKSEIWEAICCWASASLSMTEVYNSTPSRAKASANEYD
jgi:hypothetical protein